MSRLHNSSSGPYRLGGDFQQRSQLTTWLNAARVNAILCGEAIAKPREDLSPRHLAWLGTTYASTRGLNAHWNRLQFLIDMVASRVAFDSEAMFQALYELVLSGG